MNKMILLLIVFLTMYNKPALCSQQPAAAEKCHPSLEALQIAAKEQEQKYITFLWGVQQHIVSQDRKYSA